MPSSAGRTAGLTALALVCFAANSLLARAALGRGLADPDTFTAIRIGAGAGALPLILLAARGARARPRGGGWIAAASMFAYATAFSLAYVRIAAGVGALVLFVAVQATMLGWGIAHGVRPGPVQWAGIGIALAGLAALTLPGAGAPDPGGAILMAAAGIAWGVYSLRGRGTADPLATTSANFLRAAALALPLLLAGGGVRASPAGVVLAAASGALASGAGYTFWYAAVPGLGTTRAAVVQLVVPPLTAGAAVILLGEHLTVRLAGSAAAIVLGIALSLRARARPAEVPGPAPRGARA